MKRVIYYPDTINGAEDIVGQVDLKGDTHNLAVGGHKLVPTHAATRLKVTFPFLEIYTEKAWEDKGGTVGLVGASKSEEKPPVKKDIQEKEKAPDQEVEEGSFDVNAASDMGLKAKAKELGIKANQRLDALREQIAKRLSD